MDRKAAEILKKVIYAAVATSSPSSEPWNSPVYVVYDEQLNFYWASDKNSQHSRNIQANPRVCLVVYDSAVPWGTGEGVFVQAEAAEVSEADEIAKACRLRKARVTEASHPPEDFMGDHPRRMYRAAPKKVWINQDGSVNGFFVDRRAEINLDSLRSLLALS